MWIEGLLGCAARRVVSIVRVDARPLLPSARVATHSRPIHGPCAYTSLTRPESNTLIQDNWLLRAYVGSAMLAPLGRGTWVIFRSLRWLHVAGQAAAAQTPTLLRKA